jgi:hypothetical protein
MRTISSLSKQVSVLRYEVATHWIGAEDEAEGNVPGGVRGGGPGRESGPPSHWLHAKF